MIEILDYTINITEYIYIGFRYGLIISGTVGIFTVGIKYAINLLSNL